MILSCQIDILLSSLGQPDDKICETTILLSVKIYPCILKEKEWKAEDQPKKTQ